MRKKAKKKSVFLKRLNRPKKKISVFEWVSRLYWKIPCSSQQSTTIIFWSRTCILCRRTLSNQDVFISLWSFDDVCLLWKFFGNIRGTVWWDIKERVSIPWSIFMFYRMVLLELIPGGGEGPHAPPTFSSPSPIGLTWTPPPHWHVFQKVRFKTLIFIFFRS